jgi:hypothetical protein
MAKFTNRTKTCWLWTGALNNKGYGVLNMDKYGTTPFAHRIAWELANGPIPDGLNVLHKCDVPHCVNPRHLFIGTQHDNVRDMNKKGRACHPPSSINRPAPWKATVTESDVRTIRALVASGVQLTEAGKRFGITAPTVHAMVNRRTWKHVP